MGICPGWLKIFLARKGPQGRDAEEVSLPFLKEISGIPAASICHLVDSTILPGCSVGQLNLPKTDTGHQAPLSVVLRVVEMSTLPGPDGEKTVFFSQKMSLSPRVPLARCPHPLFFILGRNGP